MLYWEGLILKGGKKEYGTLQKKRLPLTGGWLSVTRDAFFITAL
jgi:hypothetical protein